MNGARILLVDDEEFLRNALRRLLERAGFEVATAGSAAQALAALEQTPAELVISDLRMPGLGGLQLLATVAQRWPQTMRVVLTGEFDSDLGVALQTGEVHHCIIKPWDNRALPASISALLAKAPAGATLH